MTQNHLKLKIQILQPRYPSDPSLEGAKQCVDWMISRLKDVKAGEADLVVLPEYANTPGLQTREELMQCIDEQKGRFGACLSEQAVRLGALLAAGTVERSREGLVNRTVLFGPDGSRLAEYDKTHLTDVESKTLGVVQGSRPVLVEWKNLRISFAVCFELYFPEYFASLAFLEPDLIITPSYQRSEEGHRIRTISACRALDSGAYLVRSSYALTDRGGHSLVAAPDGTVIADMENRVGVLSTEINPKQRFMKPASHDQPLVEHRNLIELHRKPALYRPGLEQSMAVSQFPFPRICAHRGLSASCPENTLSSFGAALALGVHEIEFDLWMSMDGVPVVLHDQNTDRTTDGKGLVTDMTWRELRKLDAGIKKGDAWKNVRVPRLEEVLALVTGRVCLNIHIKDPGPDGRLIDIVYTMLMEKGILATAYLAGDARVLEHGRKRAPGLALACLESQDDPSRQIDIALRYGCERIQFGRNVTERDITKAHKKGLICNLFYSDDPVEAREYVKMGIDVILTNCAQLMDRNIIINT